MSRHRHVRKISTGDDDYEDEMHSYDDRYAVSPATMDSYMYKRGDPTLSHFIQTEIPEEKDNIDDKPEDTIKSEEDFMFEMDSSSSKESQSNKNQLLKDMNKAQNVFETKKVEKTSNTKPDVAKLTEPLKEMKINEDNSATTSKIVSKKDIQPKQQEHSVDDIVTPKQQQQSQSQPQPQPTSTITSEYVDTKLKVIKEAYATRKPVLNVAVIGHVDAGKSTLMGHLLFQLKEVSDKIMHKYKQESQKMGKGSFAYAWIFDETEEERSRGVTIDVAQIKFEAENFFINILDTPGHKDFIPNMIMGASVADCAILVINSTKGEFETGFEAGGQTREHSLIIRSLGISQLTIAINKMDTNDWKQERYDEICKKLNLFFKQVGYKEEDIVYIPCSGLSGENLVHKPTNAKLNSWYNGGTLLDRLNSFQQVERRIDKPFRCCIADIFREQSSYVSVAGKIETGAIKIGDRVRVMPSDQTGPLKTITNDDQTEQYGFAGDNICLNIANIEATNISVGDIICDCFTEPTKFTDRFRAKIIVFNIDIPITKGFPIVFHHKFVNTSGNITKLVGQVDKASGDIIKNKPRYLTKGMSAIVEIQVSKLVGLEVNSEYKEFGRFLLRYGSSTIAAGLVTEVLPKS